MGNFSNVNLEAIKFGQVIILPKNLSATDNNETFDNIIGNKGALWIKDPSDINGLVQIIKNIYNYKLLLIKYKKLVKKNSDKIPSWSYRINKEIKLLEDLV